MLETRHLWLLASRIPRVISGAALHRLALEAMHAGAFDIAERAFEAAAARYRADLAVEPLARLRVHQLIARVRSLGSFEPGSDRVIEVERLLTRLDRIESLTPPFELVDSRSLLATWLSAEGAAPGITGAGQRAA